MTRVAGAMRRVSPGRCSRQGASLGRYRRPAAAKGSRARREGLTPAPGRSERAQYSTRPSNRSQAENGSSALACSTRATLMALRSSPDR